MVQDSSIVAHTKAGVKHRFPALAGRRPCPQERQMPRAGNPTRGIRLMSPPHRQPTPARSPVVSALLAGHHDLDVWRGVVGARIVGGAGLGHAGHVELEQAAQRHLDPELEPPQGVGRAHRHTRHDRAIRISPVAGDGDARRLVVGLVVDDTQRDDLVPLEPPWPTSRTAESRMIWLVVSICPRSAGLADHSRPINAVTCGPDIDVPLHPP